MRSGEKREAAESAARNPDYEGFSDARVAGVIGVDASWYGRVRREVNGQSPDPKKQAGARAANAKRARGRLVSGGAILGDLFDGDGVD